MVDQNDGSESDLAPVIPLFGRREPGGSPDSEAAEHADGDQASLVSEAVRHHPAGTGRLRPTRERARTSGRENGEATDVSGVHAEDASPAGPGTDTDLAGERWHTTWRDLGDTGDRERRPLRAIPEVRTVVRDGVRVVEIAADDDDATASETVERTRVEEGEKALVKALRSRSLSVGEARQRLRRDEVPDDGVDEIVERLIRVGALDDAALAEQLVHVATTRKGQGRRAIAQTLQGRGIPREVVDDVLSALPDDDAERALDFARGRAKALARHDDETALRRLVGQLGRRGFGGALAMSVARQALDESRRGNGTRGVRFH